MALPAVLHALGDGASHLYVWFMETCFERIICLGLISLLIGWALGERAKQMVGEFWRAVFGLAISGIACLARALGRCFRSTK